MEVKCGIPNRLFHTKKSGKFILLDLEKLLKKFSSPSHNIICFFEVTSMKSGVQSITVKLIDPEVKTSLEEIFANPEDFHGLIINEDSSEERVKDISEDQDNGKSEDDQKVRKSEEAPKVMGEIEASGRRYKIVRSEGEGAIGPWTEIILEVDTNETHVNMLIALDTSYSMITSFEDTTRFDLAVDGIFSLLGEKPKRLIAGIMAYGVNWEMSQDMVNAKSLTKKKQKEITTELLQTKHKGKAAAGTALNGALEVFTVKGLTDLRIVLLLTDGTDEIGPNPLKEAEKLLSKGIYIYPFYFGEESDSKSVAILDRIALKSHTNLFSLHNAVEHEKRKLIRASLRSADKDPIKPIIEPEGPSDDGIMDAEPVDIESSDSGSPEVSSEDTSENVATDSSDDTPDHSSEDLPEGSTVDFAEDSPKGGSEETDAKERVMVATIVDDETPSTEDVQSTGGEEPEDMDSSEGKEEIIVPSGSDLLLKELQQLGTSLTFLVQERGNAMLTEEDADIPVIKAGIPVEEEEQDESRELTFNRTPKIIDAIKNFIEWVKGLIW